MQHFFSQLAAFEREGQTFALCTVIDTGGSTPGRVSFHMAVLPDGRSFGTVGGGKLEHLCTEAAQEVLHQGQARIVEYQLDKSAQGIGMACGGTVRVFIEKVAARARLYIFGGGHIGTALVELASRVGFDCVVLDDREAYANSERHPRAIETRVADYELLAQGPFVESGSFVVVTHQHAGDEKALRGVLRHATSPRYVGVIGSALKVRDMYRRMLADGFERGELEQIYAPIGIDHGGQSAEEIALAICAELVAARHGKQLADSMRTRSTLLEQLSPQD